MSTPALSLSSIPPTSSSSDIVQQKIVQPTQTTFSPTSQSVVIPSSSLSSSSNISDVDKMIENFHYAPFTLGPISSINMEEAGLALRQAGLTQVDIGKVDANIHPEMSLLEHILLKMDFNYLDTVPPSQKLL